MNTQVQSKKADEVKTLPLAKKENVATEEKKKIFDNFLEKLKPEPIKTAEQRIELMKQLEAHTTRFSALKEKSNEMKMFAAGNDKLTSKIVFSNAQGFKFEVSNANVIEKLVKSAQDELSILLSEAEIQVLTFEI